MSQPKDPAEAQAGSSTNPGEIANEVASVIQELSEPADSDTITRLNFGGKTYILVGTAHVSQESIAEVAQAIETYQPDRVGIELDQGRYNSMTQADSWQNLDVFKVIRQGKGFMLLANLVMGSFQKRMGMDSGAKPGEEMREAIRVCNEKNIPFSLIDREIQVTLNRAWSKSSFWGKSKLLGALVSSAFSNEKMSAEQVEDLKKKSALQGMMQELGEYLPSVKSVLIDERDQFLACRLFDEPGEKILAVVGAGHVPGMIKWLNDLHAGTASSDLSAISAVPKGAPVAKILGLVIPLAIIGLIVVSFVNGGWQVGFAKLLTWLLWNGGLAALGTLAGLGHPLAILAAFVGAPIATLNPLIGVGLFAAGAEAFFRKPRVSDLENLQNDVTSLKGFYRNRVTRILLIFVLSSVGGMIGNFISIPAIFPH